ncbi:cytochrome P450 2A6-like [Pseudophryne corroboree]|uniref:cytochrome P450 2A6-like n=1 Tax=Pseudophryne corroboree TaxID=495146 RepID=UPI00308217A0
MSRQNTEMSRIATCMEQIRADNSHMMNTLARIMDDQMRQHQNYLNLLETNNKLTESLGRIIENNTASNTQLNATFTNLSHNITLLNTQQINVNTPKTTTALLTGPDKNSQCPHSSAAREGRNSAESPQIQNCIDMTDIQSITVLLVALVTVLLVVSYGKYAWRRRKMPPGPFPLPILGNYLQFHSDGLVSGLVKVSAGLMNFELYVAMLSLNKVDNLVGFPSWDQRVLMGQFFLGQDYTKDKSTNISEKYGPVSTAYLGCRPYVVLSGYQAIKEALVDMGDAFLDRGNMPLVLRIFNNAGLGFTSGETWKQLRQFSLMTLRDFGMGKKTLEEPIQEEAQHLVEHFKGLNEQPYDPCNTLTCAGSNIMSNILLGSRHDYSDKKWMKILQDSVAAFHIISSKWGQIYDMFPKIMQYLPGPHEKIFTLLKPLKNYMKENLRSHQETLDPACPRDFADCFLIRMKQEEKTLKTPFNMANLLESVFDMFLGGSQSTAITVNFGFLILIKYPELQDKLHEEIDRVIGQIRQPRVEDRNQMPYMNAVLHEIQRISNVFPMGIFRCTNRDVNFRGFCIPKGTDVIVMLITVLQESSEFETPGEFNIYHFLDESGKLKKINGFLPFSTGKRSCVAESLVRLELFIFFTVILQKFTLKSIVDPKDLNISPVESGMESIPPSHKMIFISRV